MRRICCITDMIWHIVVKSSQIFKGTTNKNNWVFYHDALSLMTSKECINWMQNKKYKGKTLYERWLLPTNNLNKGTRYESTVVGNSPEFMPLDNSLNRDLQVNHDHHCIVTSHLPQCDTRRFSKSTPKNIERGILKIWNHAEGAPCALRVKQDIERAVESMAAVVAAGGKMVPGLANRNGHRNESGGKKGKRGGKRVKGTGIVHNAQWLHPSVRGVVADMKKMVVKKYKISK